MFAQVAGQWELCWYVDARADGDLKSAALYVVGAPNFWERIWEQDSAKRPEIVRMRSYHSDAGPVLSCIFKTERTPESPWDAAHNPEVASATDPSGQIRQTFSPPGSRWSK
jgi:hypothetical protein